MVLISDSLAKRDEVFNNFTGLVIQVFYFSGGSEKTEFRYHGEAQSGLFNLRCSGAVFSQIIGERLQRVI